MLVEATSRLGETMKKFLAAIALFFLAFAALADEFKITRKIPRGFTGTYVSVAFDETLRETHSYEKP